MTNRKQSLVIFGSSNILSDIFDAALSNGLPVSKVVLHEPEGTEPRSIPVEQRVRAMVAHGVAPEIVALDQFQPGEGELYLLGPTTPTRRRLADEVSARWRISFHTLIHRTAYVSPLSSLGEGVFVGANSVVAPGTILARHVFVNRGVTIGHDNDIGEFSRIQPGVSMGGLSRIGVGVTIGLGATLLERLHVGDHAVIAGGAVVLKDVPALVMVAGAPATVRKQLEGGL